MRSAARAVAFTMLAATAYAIVLVAGSPSAGRAPFEIAFGALLQQVIGSGETVSQVRSEPPFHRIAVNGSPDVRVTVGVGQSVVVEAQRNVADVIDTSVEDGTLTVSPRRSYTTHRPAVVSIGVPELSAITVHGSSDVVVRGARGPRLDLAVRGSGDVTAEGSVERLTYSSYGSGDGRLRRLAVRDAVVRVRGSGDAELSVSGTLDVEVYGSGDVTYAGRPRILRQSIRGSGSVAPA